MTQKLAMYIDKIKRPDFFQKPKLEHYVYLYFWIFRRNLYRTVKEIFTECCTDFM